MASVLEEVDRGRAPMLIDGIPGTAISAADRGLQYGDGLFETIAVCDGKPKLWQRHMQRLAVGCRRLAITCPALELLETETARLLPANATGVLKILLSRGQGGRGYRPPAVATPSRILSFHPRPEYPRQWWIDGIRLRVCDTRIGASPALAGVKHLNRLEQVLARAEWDDTDIAEGLMLDANGHAVEGTMSNLFMLREDKLYTPELHQSGVAGVMRGQVMDEARAIGLTPAECTMGLDDLLSAQALFVTNSLIGIWPVKRLLKRRYDVAAIPPALRVQAVRHGLYEHLA